eukprot:TRINITY_DN1713_c0_g1_i1.p1 TRINITY_DN1713_c0_g1~~TRINITY_DN1713_c0_g1_i1.p1  ORF type:complete len:216 (+),score=56.49 TRINITY_DN1713_c0_g1_i1:40-687(+)
MTARRVAEFKECLGLNEFEKKKASKARKRKNKKLRQKASNQVVQTLASAYKEQTNCPEIVKFQSHKSSKKKVSAKEEAEEFDASDGQDLVSVDQVRHEIFKFGLSGLSKSEQKDAKIALAIKLGAKPPKNQCIPLQELKDKRRKEKAEKEEREAENESKLLKRQKTSTKGQSDKILKKAGKKTKRKGGDGVQTKIGSFDGGMLKISKDDFKRIKR